MLGLLGNVAEVKGLRPQLMTSQFISVFRLVLPGLQKTQNSRVYCEHTVLCLGFCYWYSFYL